MGLLTIGAEPGKGNKLARRAHELLADDPPHGGLPISFVGNIEGGDLLAGKVDVIVTDGFTGNVALKTLEGAVRVRGRAAAETATGVRRPPGSARCCSAGELRELAERLDSETYGGAALLGLDGTVVIAHGASRARGVTSACRAGRRPARGQITEQDQGTAGPGGTSCAGRCHARHSRTCRVHGRARAIVHRAMRALAPHKFRELPARRMNRSRRHQVEPGRPGGPSL